MNQYWCENETAYKTQLTRQRKQNASTNEGGPQTNTGKCIPIEIRNARSHNKKKKKRRRITSANKIVKTRDRDCEYANCSFVPEISNNDSYADSTYCLCRTGQTAVNRSKVSL